MIGPCFSGRNRRLTTILLCFFQSSINPRNSCLKIHSVTNSQISKRFYLLIPNSDTLFDMPKFPRLRVMGLGFVGLGF